MPIVVRIAVKPTSSIAKEQETVNTYGEKVKLSIKGRHDPCICPRIVPVAESMVALVLVDHLMIQEGTKGVEQSIEVLRNQIDLVDTDIIGLLSERKKIVENIGRIKKEKRLNVRDVKREKEVLKQRKKIAKDFGLDEKFVAFIFQKLMDYAKQAQKLKNKK